MLPFHDLNGGQLEEEGNAIEGSPSDSFESHIPQTKERK